MRPQYLILILAIALISGCDGGLDPTTLPKTARIYGTVSYSKGWPPLDSLQDIRVAAFQETPEKIEDIFSAILSGNAYFTAQSLEKRVASSSYMIEIPNPPVTIKYIAVAQQYGKNYTQDWKLIGVYSTKGDPMRPDSLKVKPGDIFRNINIYVDFSNLPPQPFK